MKDARKVFWGGVKYFIKNMKYDTLQRVTYKGKTFFTLERVLLFVENEGNLPKCKYLDESNKQQMKLLNQLEHDYSLYFITGRKEYLWDVLGSCGEMVYFFK